MIGTLDGVPQLLVLKVPPTGVACGDACEEHASHKLTCRVEARGGFAPRLRVEESFFRSCRKMTGYRMDIFRGAPYPSGGTARAL